MQPDSIILIKPMANKQNSPILALQQQRLLLQMEYEAEKEAYRKQTEETGLQRKYFL